ncbi:MAG: hypothetical protein ACOYEV_18945 [Candidatus Nanopelagicales bacterium]
MSERYVVVDGSVIVGGPYMWNGSSSWVAPEVQTDPSLVCILLAVAQQRGYTWADG